MEAINHRAFKKIVGICVIATLLTGCGLMNHLNSPVQNKLGVDNAHPIATFNAVSASGTTYNQIEVLTSTGQTIQLDATKTPILFVAYWCPHCQRTLVAFLKHVPRNQMPIIVSLGFVPGTSLAYAQQLTHEEWAALHFSEQNIQVDYVLGQAASQYVKDGYPTFVFSYHHQLLKLVGEHVWPIWAKALAGQA